MSKDYERHHFARNRTYTSQLSFHSAARRRTVVHDQVVFLPWRGILWRDHGRRTCRSQAGWGRLPRIAI